jgi:hypothetical protein
MPTKTISYREAFIQAKLKQAHETKGDYVIRIKLCDKPGIPDLLVIPKDTTQRPFFIEVKTQTGRVDPLQHFRAKELKKYDIATTYVVDWRKDAPVTKIFTEGEIACMLGMDSMKELKIDYDKFIEKYMKRKKINKAKKNAKQKAEKKALPDTPEPF